MSHLWRGLARSNRSDQGLAFGEATSDVAAGGLVVTHPGQHDAVERWISVAPFSRYRHLLRSGGFETAIQRKAGRAVNSLLRPLGLQVTRLRFRSSDFYQPSPSCQIPTLGFLYELFFGQAEHGFFVEVGAYDGYSFSNTSCLAERGWSGLLIEPVSEYADQCRDRYSNREDIEILQVAVGSSDGTLSLHIAGPFTTASESQFTEYRELSAKELARDDTVISVQQSTLDAILESSEIEHSFDLLVVDVEGYECYLRIKILPFGQELSVGGSLHSVEDAFVAEYRLGTLRQRQRRCREHSENEDE